MANCNTTVLMSGGIDSTACAHLLQNRGNTIRGVFIDYGQAAAKFERRAAEEVAALLKAPLVIVAASGGVGFSSGELVGRNAFLIFSALFLSRCHAGLLAIGTHSGTPYYDCSPAFFDLIARLVGEHTDGAVSLVAPFLHWTKAQVFDYFTASGLPVGATYSCEAGIESGCGACASCRDRQALGC